MKQTKARSRRFSFHFVSKKRYVVGLLFLSILLSLFFTLFKFNTTPPCFNADEAAFGYNAYSLLQTGADEYGNTLPVRLKSFGDYKMPLYSYLSIPIIGAFDLNEQSVRGLNVLLALLFPILVFFLTKKLFGKDAIGAIAALLVSVSLGLGIVSHHAHEALLAAFLITLTFYLFVIFLQSQKIFYGILSISTLFLSLFTYQSSRIYALFFFLFALGHFIYKKKFNKVTILFLSLFIVAVGLFAITDVIYKPTRVANLLLINNEGFSLKLLELRGEGGNPYAYNKLAIGAKEVIFHHLSYYSPQFLAVDGDENKRFGFPGMSPMTPIEYMFVFIGFYYLFKRKEKWRYLLLGLIIIAPFSAALSWADASLTRSLFLLIPLLIVSSYGVYRFILKVKERKRLRYLLPLLLLAESIFLYYSWDFYFNHYSQRGTVIRSWQCGYKELANYVEKNYDKNDKFYITQKNGEPYIFMLFYLKFSPVEYQKQAVLSAPDEYGFGQVEKFDKFDFSFPTSALREKNVVLVGYPDDFNDLPIDTNRLKKIIIGNEEIFWIYETK